MGKLKEYLKLLPKAIENFDQVVEGIKNNIALENSFLNEEQIEVITARRLICQQCPYMSKNAVEAGIYTTEREEEHCMHCQCIIKYKTSCLSCNCGIEAYNKTHPNNELKLKWEAVDL